MNTNRKKLISIDLDGVLNTYHGDYNPVVISPPREGVHEFLKNLSEQFIVDIFTSRDSKLVWNWLKEHELYKFINNVTNAKKRQLYTILHKPPFICHAEFISASP